MPLAVGEVSLNGCTLAAKLLPEGSRSVVKTKIQASAAIAKGASSASLKTASGTANLKAGTSLLFNAASPSGQTQRKQIILNADVSLSATASTVGIFPARLGVALNDEYDYVADLIPVFGLQTFDLSTNSQTEDTTDTLSGAGMENAVIRRGMTFQFSVVERLFDLGLEETIKALALDYDKINNEMYAVFTYPNGEAYEGAAKITEFSIPGNQNTVKKVNFTLSFMGQSFIRTKAYTFA